MTINRRKFVTNSLKAGALGLVAGSGMVSCNLNTADKPTGKLKILILGGTSFLGPHQVAYALERGHTISTFTRGKTMPTVNREAFDKVEMLIGDRENNLEALKNRQWDVIIDNSGYRVHWTEATARLLKDNAALYIYTSSTGVYYPYLGKGIKEDTPLVLNTPAGVNAEQKMEYDYGVMKANSEIAVQKEFGTARSLICRPTYMIGPGDKSDRFIHWPIRLNRGGEILIPGRSDDPIQFMDVRDVAQWMIHLAEKKNAGTYNVVGPQEPMQIESFMNEIRQAFDVDMSFIQVDNYDFLKSNKIEHIVPWIMPEGNNFGSARISNTKVLATGLTFRPLNQTIRDTYKWWHSDALSEERRQQFENDPNTVMAREEEIIKYWKQLNS